LARLRPILPRGGLDPPAGIKTTRGKFKKYKTDFEKMSP
jgi:hypothetical protein